MPFAGDYSKFMLDFGVNTSSSSSGSGHASSQMRPVYMLAVEEEINDQDLPKSLLKLSISDGSSRGIDARLPPIEYILDARMDDLNDVFNNFAVNKSTGELFLITPLDRDPPKGRFLGSLGTATCPN